jgi:hypothetical protein
MTGRRLLAAAGAALAGLLLAATPASAAEPTVEWTRPTDDDRVIKASSDLVLRGTVTGDDGDEIESVSFSLAPTGAPEPEADPCRAVIDGSSEIRPASPVPIEFELPLKAPCNRTYEVVATITRPRILGVCGRLGESCTTEVLPLVFDVAIPPARVSGLKAAYDPGSKEVRLTWDANTEVDLRGYRVERNPPGPAGFETVAELGKGETAFTDKDITDEHRYRVTALREGPNEVPISGTPSAVVTVGPDAPEPTVPKVTPTTRGTTATTRRSAGAGGDRPAVRRRTATTVDTGFSQNLPFDPSQTTTSQLPTTTSEPDGEAAVLAEFDDDDGDDRRATLVPIAGGLALLMSAVHVRLLSKRVGDDDIPVFPSS